MCKVSICISFIKLRWPKNKSLRVRILLLLFFSLAVIYFFGLMLFDMLRLFVCFVFFTRVFVFLYLFMNFPPTPLPLHFFKGSQKSGRDIDVLCSPMLGKGLSPCATGDSACRIPNQTSNLQVLKFCFVYFFSDSLLSLH